jgi:hypothetical protein
MHQVIQVMIAVLEAMIAAVYYLVMGQMATAADHFLLESETVRFRRRATESKVMKGQMTLQ